MSAPVLQWEDKMKKIISMIITISLLLMGVTSVSYAAVSITVDANVNNNTKVVNIFGIISSGQGESVTVRVVNPSGGTDYVDQTKSSANGSYQFTYVLDENVGGTYNVYIRGTGVSSPECKTFTYTPATNGGEGPTPDSIPPVISLLGDSTVSIVVGSTYTEPGVTAIDDTDGVITSRVVKGGVVNTSVPGTYTLTYNVTDTAGNHAVQVMRTVVVTAVESIPITSTNVTISAENKNVSVTPETIALGAPITVSVPSSETNATVSVAQLITATVTGNVTTSTLPQLNISAQTALGANPIQVVIPQGVTISAPASGNWDGTINVPKLQGNNTVHITADPGKTAIVSAVIEVGYDDVPLTLSKAVRILIPGMAGQETGYYRGTTFTRITATITEDTQGAADTQIAAGGDAAIDVGLDKVIWTKHLTKFVTYTQTVVSGGDDPSDIDTPSTPRPTPTPPQQAVKLTDIEGHWAEANINKLVASGAISGYPDGSFKPDNKITRAEFIKMLVEALKLQVKAGKVFADTDTHWAKDYISTANANGIVAGYNDTTFGPNDLITREQMAVIVVNTAKLKATTEGNSFTDEALISHWAKSAVATAKKNAVILGYPDLSFKPLANATRAEAVTVIMKTLELVK